MSHAMGMQLPFFFFFSAFITAPFIQVYINLQWSIVETSLTLEYTKVTSSVEIVLSFEMKCKINRFQNYPRITKIMCKYKYVLECCVWLLVCVALDFLL
jgi:hypothetical protein